MNKTPSDSFRTQPLRVLIVDDDAEDRCLLGFKLNEIKSPGIELLGASNLSSALRALETESVDLCMVDFVLSDNETGLELLRAARRQLHRLPFIAVSGVIDEEELTHTLLSEGFDDVVSKSDLLNSNIDRIVRNAVLRSRYIRSLVDNSSTDDLTGLLNRRAMMQRLEWERFKALRANSEITVLYIDINGFKLINDQFGHAAGDVALKHLARLLGTISRKTDAVCRPAGDEFVLILSGSTAKFGEQMRDRIRQLLEETPLSLGGKSVHLKVSIGVAGLDPKTAVTSEDLIGNADANMYRSKDKKQFSMINALTATR